MPPKQRKKRLNEAINWILGKLVKLNQIIEGSEEDEELSLPRKLHINEIVAATGVPYSTWRDYSLYIEMDRRFNCLSYQKNRGYFAISHDKIAEDIETREEKFL